MLLHVGLGQSGSRAVWVHVASLAPPERPTLCCLDTSTASREIMLHPSLEGRAQRVHGELGHRAGRGAPW